MYTHSCIYAYTFYFICVLFLYCRKFGEGTGSLFQPFAYSLDMGPLLTNLFLWEIAATNCERGDSDVREGVKGEDDQNIIKTKGDLLEK